MLTRIRMAVLTALSIAGLFCAAESHAQILGPASISDFVTLHDSPGGGPCDWTRMNYNGTRPQFIMPENTALVITSIQWSLSDSLPDGRSYLELIRGTGDPTYYTDTTYELLAMVDGGNADAWGHVAGHGTFPTGVVVTPRSNSRLCWHVKGALPHDVRVTL